MAVHSKHSPPHLEKGIFRCSKVLVRQLLCAFASPKIDALSCGHFDTCTAGPQPGKATLLWCITTQILAPSKRFRAPAPRPGNTFHARI